MQEIRKLYHYCSLKTAIEYILPKKELLLNPVGNTNDPRESKGYTFVPHGRSEIMQDINPWTLSDEITYHVRKDCKQICFSKDDIDLKGYEFSRLWALYGDNHEGVCLEIDLNSFKEENSALINEKLFKPIIYDESYKMPLSLMADFNVITAKGISDFVKDDLRMDNIDYFFFKKNKEWESESEVRLLYISENEENEYCTIKKSLSRIILGVDFIEQYYPSIKKNCENIPIQKLSYWNYRFGFINLD